VEGIELCGRITHPLRKPQRVGPPFHLWDTACYKGIVGHPPTCPQGLKPESGTDSIPAAEAVGFHDSADGRDGEEAKKN
jgi:hypothetical protein